MEKKPINSILIVVSGGSVVSVESDKEDVNVNILDMDTLKQTMSTTEAEKIYQEYTKRFSILNY